jgi:hypothetical protein
MARYPFVEDTGGQYQVAPADLYKAASQEVKGVLDNNEPVRPSQMSLVESFRRLPAGALDSVGRPSTELSKKEREGRSQAMGLLRKWFTQNLAADMGADGISLDISSDEAYKE